MFHHIPGRSDESPSTEVEGHSRSRELAYRKEASTRTALLVVAAILYTIWLLTMLFSQTSVFGKLAACFVVAGNFRLIWLVAEVWEQPKYVALAIFVPFYNWYFAFKNWTIAKAPFLCALIGTAIGVVDQLTQFPQLR